MIGYIVCEPAMSYVIGSKLTQKDLPIAVRCNPYELLTVYYYSEVQKFAEVFFTEKDVTAEVEKDIYYIRSATVEEILTVEDLMKKHKNYVIQHTYRAVVNEIPQSVALASQKYSKSENLRKGYSSVAASTEKGCVAENNGSIGIAANTGNYGLAYNTESSGIAANTGEISVAFSTGMASVAASTIGDSVNTGVYGIAAGTIDNSAVVTEGVNGVAVTTGCNTLVIANGLNSIALGAGAHDKAKGRLGSYLVLTEWVDGEISNIRMARVDGIKIKSDTYYMLKDNKFIKC